MTLSDPLQLISVLLIGTGVFLYDPQKIPEMARAVARLGKEFESAQKQVRQVYGELQKQMEPSGKTAVESTLAVGQLSGSTDTRAAAPSRYEGRTADEILINAAQELGIVTQGKTREELGQEILFKAKTSSQSKL